MASNQGRQGLDKPARDTLSAIDKALEDLVQAASEKQEGEFTLKEVAIASGKDMSYLRHEAERMVKAKIWIRRKPGGKVFFRRAKIEIDTAI